MKKLLALLVWGLGYCSLVAQSGIIKGTITNSINNEPISFATVLVLGTDSGTTSDLDGNYEVRGLAPGLYSIRASYVGFDDFTEYEIQVFNNKPAEIDIQMSEAVQELEEVVVKASPFKKTEESPVSLRSIGVAEIQRNPGGNRDISLVVQQLPGVTSSASFRNDLIIRGGAPNENRFYLDEVEVPTINHFATQGSSGGPVGMINVNFIQEVDFYSGAFPANRGNTLSSVFGFRLRDGRDDRLGGSFTVGSSDLNFTLEGPIGKKTTFLASARQSYLGFLFELLELPFLPTYNDFQLKVKHKIDQRNELTLIGLGAIDQFELNLEANET
ncbi:MAG: TonB-dependent receptor [Bacteroidota bacterium]